MKLPKVKDVWLDTYGGDMELRVDFDNDRHHAMMISTPHGKEELARALEALAANVRRDWKLTPHK